MSEFERALPIYRLIETHHGDTLESVAHRELGDANRWPELIWLNQLIPPYLTDDPALSGPSVLLNGSMIRVPSPAGLTTGDKSTAEDVYEKDILLTGKRLTADESGDFAVAVGVKNLTQQLTHAIITPRGNLRRHPGYGCLVWRVLGAKIGPSAGFIGGSYVRSTLEADYRVTRVTHANVSVQGDAIKIFAQAEASPGGTIEINV